MILFIIRLWTSLYSGFIATLETDIKKIIALSTLRQIRFITIAFSLRIIYLSFLHLLTHALFKASLFFWAGIYIHRIKSEQIFITFNRKRIKNRQSFLFLIFISLIGFPISIGFYSKDLILDLIKPNYFLTINIVFNCSIFLTIFYTIRFIKKINNINYNKINYKILYFNILNIIISFIIFRSMLLLNKILNETWFKRRFVIVTKGWKLTFIIIIATRIIIRWLIKHLIFDKNIIKIIFLNFFTIKINTKNIFNLLYKISFIEFGWLNNIRIKLTKNLIKITSILNKNYNYIIIMIILNIFVIININF